MHTVSIVIPVYNEAAYLPACLEAIAAQTMKPYEVIIVDNNSTDETAAIAEQYDFVHLLREPRQGVVYARDRGFDATRGSVIGRIDADTVISPDWVETIQSIFVDDSLSGVCGGAVYYDVRWPALLNTMDALCRRFVAWGQGDEVSMQGANMAIRRAAWQQIRAEVCHKKGMHEDFDLSAHFALQKLKVKLDLNLRAGLSYRLVQSSYPEFITYILLGTRTYAAHGVGSRAYMYPVTGMLFLCYLPLKFLYQGYDAARVNPATFVDL